MFIIFALLFFVSIVNVAKSEEVPQQDAVCGYGTLRNCGLSCWEKCSTYDRDPNSVNDVLISCKSDCSAPQCECMMGLIIDDQAGGKCVLPNDCKNFSEDKKSP